MRGRTTRYNRQAKWLVSLSALALAACATPMPTVAPEAPVVAPPVPQVVQGPSATPGLPARERLQLAINLLSQGDPARANIELKAYLAEVPDSRQARTLVSHIETPVAQLFPAENFTVQLGRDETLSTLAGVFLGDVTGFYALARYNNIAIPDRVNEGQTIRIPRTPQSLAALATRNAQTPPPQATVAPPGGAPPAGAAPPRTRDPWAIVRDEVAAGRWEVAIREAETNRLTPDRTQAVMLANAYLSNARATRTANARLAGAQALRAGQLFLESADRPEDAIEPLQLAVTLVPADMRAQTLLASARGKAADVHYRTGLAAFQRQDLDRAIASWDRALVIDPGHKNAQLNRAQAVELKQNLQRLR